ncbi:MAG TPA: CaiB/BaiF CoA-transferase family protein [Candidatus Sulfotelmatobacter sp.]|jgi:formyl-CoA transferase|nr:CaiB/BaiF CoA-transferase family protein [Candidatus Sulfotelmatobacter sp.]
MNDNEKKAAETHVAGPLAGVKVLELGQLIAGPFATAFLAWFGADVIKVEPPGTGDPLRTWRVVHQGTSLWWHLMARNKKCVTLDLRVPEGQKIAREMAGRVDVMIENFRPGTLEKWGLGYEELKKENPGLILARISGYGQTGPYAQKPGFAAVAEAFGGLRYVTGEPDRPPVRPNLSLGDSVAGLHAALGILMALYHRDARGGSGQVIDVALYEAVLNLMEGTIPEYDKAGVKREREGMRLTGIVPSGTYPCADGAYIVIGANGDSIFRRFMIAIGRADLAGDARLVSNEGRSKHIDEIDEAITAWTRTKQPAEALKTLSEADVPSGPIYSAEEMLADPHYKARGVFQEADLGGGDRVKLPQLAPRLDATPGEMRWIGPTLGEHNNEVYRDWLGYPAAELERLSREGVI